MLLTLILQQQNAILQLVPTVNIVNRTVLPSYSMLCLEVVLCQLFYTNIYDDMMMMMYCGPIYEQHVQAGSLKTWTSKTFPMTVHLPTMMK